MTARVADRSSGRLPGDRRGPRRGDQRRSALLRSLDGQLRDGSLDAVNVADISREAGVTRSAFYFYFESKAVAVAALMAEFYDEAFAAAEVLNGLTAGEASAAERIEAAIRGLFDAFEKHRHVYQAMLDARAESAAVRDMWDADRDVFVPVVADLVRAERAAGRAGPGPDETMLATVLLDLVDRSVERLARSGAADHAAQAEAVVTIWLRTIFGRVDGGSSEGAHA